MARNWAIGHGGIHLPTVNDSKKSPMGTSLNDMFNLWHLSTICSWFWMVRIIDAVLRERFVQQK